MSIGKLYLLQNERDRCIRTIENILNSKCWGTSDPQDGMLEDVDRLQSVIDLLNELVIYPQFVYRDLNATVDILSVGTSRDEPSDYLQDDRTQAFSLH